MCDYNKIINSDTITGLGIGLSISLMARYMIKPKEMKPMNGIDYCVMAIVGFSAATNLADRPLYSSLMIGGLIGGLISRSMNTSYEELEDIYTNVGDNKLEPIPE
jgi:hypothetical protein